MKSKCIKMRCRCLRFVSLPNGSEGWSAACTSIFCSYSLDIRAVSCVLFSKSVDVKINLKKKYLDFNKDIPFNFK